MYKYFLTSALIICSQLSAAESQNMTPKTGEFVWNELATPNIQKSKEFYEQVFGWKFVDKKMDDMTYTKIKKGDNEFAGMWEVPSSLQNQIPSHWLAYILVDNVESALEKAVQNGAVMIKPVQKAGDMGLFAIIKDPTGAHVGLWQSLKK
jgi:predicted enzyme related to lactoylglutathione lyase